MALGRGRLSAILALCLVATAAYADPLKICVKREDSSDCDVVENNDPKPGYVITEDGTADDLVSFGESDDSATFKVFVAGGDLKSPEIVSIAEDSTIEPAVTYAFSENGLSDGESGAITVSFNCASQGKTTFVVAIKDGSAQGSGPLVEFSATKSCGGVAASQDSERIKGVEIATPEIMDSELRPDGETVKRLSKDGDVVSNGKTRREFVVGDGKDLFPVAAKKRFSEFYIQSSRASKIEFAEPVVFAESSVCRPELSGSAASGGILKKPKNLAEDGPKVRRKRITLPGSGAVADSFAAYRDDEESDQINKSSIAALFLFFLLLLPSPSSPFYKNTESRGNLQLPQIRLDSSDCANSIPPRRLCDVYCKQDL